MLELPVYAYTISAGVIRFVAEAVVGVLLGDHDERAMFAASPRVPPPGTGWVPAPYLSPRVQIRLGRRVNFGRPSGAGFKILRVTLLTLANAGVVELHTSPMATSTVGRVRFVRLCPRAGHEWPIDFARVIPDSGHVHRRGVRH